MNKPKCKKKIEFTYDINRCDNIFDSSDGQPYLDSTEGGKWGKGKDDMPNTLNDYTPYNNPLPY